VRSLIFVDGILAGFFKCIQELLSLFYTKWASLDSLQKILKGCLKHRKADQYRLYALFSKKMFGLCQRYAASYDEAQDVLQEGFIKVFEQLPSYKGKGSLEAWIRRIFINTAIAKYRQRIYHLSLDDVVDYEGHVNQNHGPGSLNTKDILAYVQALPVQYRLVFNLYALEGYSHKEIAETLDISESTSRSNLARARMQLKDKLGKEMKVVYRAI